MRELVYYVATTLDGYIAREDGSFSDFPWDDDFGAYLLHHFPETFPAHLRPGPADRSQNRRFDAVVMGRKTYEVGLREGITCPYPTLDQFVLSRTLRSSPDPGVTLISEDGAAEIARLKERQGRAIWICGGGQLASFLLLAGLINRVIVKLNPVLFGRGIPMLHEAVPTTRLDLVESRNFPSGHVLLEYSVADG